MTKWVTWEVKASTIYVSKLSYGGTLQVLIHVAQCGFKC